jgi:hypothetical protein
MVVRLMIDAARCGSPSSPSRGTLAGAARDLVTHHAVGLPRGGVALGSGVKGGSRGGGAGAGFVVQLLPPSCQAEYALVISGWTPGVTDQELPWSEVWLGNRSHLVGVTAGLSLLAQGTQCQPP